MQKISILSISILIFLSSCKQAPPAITESEKDILQQILAENESIHSFLMKEEGKIPDTNKLIVRVRELISLNGGLKDSAEKMESSLQIKTLKTLKNSSKPILPSLRISRTV